VVAVGVVPGEEGSDGVVTHVVCVQHGGVEA
jgi:hypothetical protein